MEGSKEGIGMVRSASRVDDIASAFWMARMQWGEVRVQEAREKKVAPQG